MNVSPYEMGMGYCGKCHKYVEPDDGLRCPDCGYRVRMGARLLRQRHPPKTYEVIDYGDGMPRCGNCRSRLRPDSPTINNRVWRCSNEECGWEIKLGPDMAMAEIIDHGGGT